MGSSGVAREGHPHTQTATHTRHTDAHNTVTHGARACPSIPRSDPFRPVLDPSTATPFPPRPQPYALRWPFSSCRSFRPVRPFRLFSVVPAFSVISAVSPISAVLAASGIGSDVCKTTPPPPALDRIIIRSTTIPVICVVSAVSAVWAVPAIPAVSSFLPLRPFVWPFEPFRPFRPFFQARCPENP
mgnify:CR=1 FL=1